jgi:hypothetical protein
MPIEVTCPGCKKRFRVSDNFAGQKGPCPSCKAEIQVPEKSEEVVIHAPEPVSSVEAQRRRMFRPITRAETAVTPTSIAGVVGAVVVVLLVALMLRFAIKDKEQFPVWILTAGAILLAPPLALAGYTLLRDAELEPYRGQPLMIRTAICAAVYAGLWGVYAGVRAYAFGDAELQPFHYLFLIVPFVAVGALAAYASFDLDYGIGAIHYGLYLLVTLTLCFIMGVPMR